MIVGDRALATEAVEHAEERACGHGAVQEACILLTKDVARKDDRGLLQA